MKRSVTDQATNDRLRDQQKRDRVTNDLVVTSLLGTREGRRWVWNRLAECNIFSQTVRFGPDGHALSAFEEGKRSLGLALLADIMRLAPQQYVVMTTENTVKEEQDARSSTDDSDTDPGASPRAD